MDEKESTATQWTNPSSVPPHGWSVRSDYVFPQSRSQKTRASFRQTWNILPLILRYVWQYIQLWFINRKPVMDFISVVQNKKKSGVPLGGIGAGTIGRGFKGEFCRFQMRPGIYEYEDVLANQFIVTINDTTGKPIYQKVLSTYNQKKFFSPLSKWDWTFPPENAHYTALYPQAWYVYYVQDDIQHIDMKLTCHQISPVIPHNYKDSSYPVSAFEWFIENNNSNEFQVSITMTIRDGDGTKHSGKDVKKTELFTLSSDDGAVEGVTIEQRIAGTECYYSIASRQNGCTVVSKCAFFDPSSDGKRFWESIPSNQFEKPERYIGVGAVGCAVKSSIKLKGLEKNSSICFALSWDMPRAYFPQSSRYHLRYYTKYFGSNNDAGPRLCREALTSYERWSKQIHDWQTPILNDKRLPQWYKSALFNELYYVSDGGTLWVLLNEDEAEKLSENDPRNVYGRFGYLEGHEYRMYNTYDVHFYASFALSMLWPGLQRSLQYDIRDAVVSKDNTLIKYLYSGETAPRKVENTVPHDVGDPEYNPFDVINSYPIHDVSTWKDLNSKYVLQVYRDFMITEDLNDLRYLYPQVVAVMKFSLRWDSNGDGVIHNGGYPDQTYDLWVMDGISAYCGGLWLAAVSATVKMAELMNDTPTYAQFSDILSRGKKVFDDTLWNGSYFLFDSSGKPHSDTIMSDQLCGLWYLKSCNINDEVFVNNHARTALKTIYEANVQNYYGATQGAVNGMKPNGTVDTTVTQSEESWTGVTYALASLMIMEGMVEEGFVTAKGLYETVFNKAGLGFATPEALHRLDSYRSVGYMRPLSIWSIQHALNTRFGSE